LSFSRCGDASRLGGSLLFQLCQNCGTFGPSSFSNLRGIQSSRRLLGFDVCGLGSRLGLRQFSGASASMHATAPASGQDALPTQHLLHVSPGLTEAFRY
jgi:hypothetical protein